MQAAAAASEQTIEEEMGLAGAVADDAEAECIRRITETQIVTGTCVGQVMIRIFMKQAIGHENTCLLSEFI